MENKTINDILDGDVIVEVDENKITAHKEVGVKGNYTYDDNPFAHDLFPGEQILKDEHVVLNSPSLTFEQKLLVYLTCGLYYLYLRYCGCCRPKELYGTRARLAVTSHSRALLWESDLHGVETPPVCFCIPGFKTLGSHTIISTFSLRKLSYVERGYSRDQRCCGICPARMDSSLRLFFNDYPDQVHVDAMQFAILPRAVTMSKLAAIPNSYWWQYAFSRFAGYMAGNAVLGIISAIQDTAFGCFDRIRTQMLFLKIGWGTLNVLEISSPYNDKMKKDGSDYTNMLQLENIIMEMRNPPNCISAQPAIDPEKWTMVKDAQHLVENSGAPGGRVNLRERDLGLLKDEYVVDAFPSRLSWSISDVLYTIFTASLYYWIYLRRKFNTRGALVLTNKRLFELFAFSNVGNFDPLAQGQVPDFDFVTRFWLFGRLSQGYVEWYNDFVFAHIKTKYGGLVITPAIQEVNCCIPWLYGIRAENKERLKNFLIKFSQTNEQPLLGQNLAGNVDPECWTLKHWAPVGGEVPLRKIESEFCWDCQNTITKYCNCGIQPFVPAQEFVVSTHRLWATARASNDPWCLKDCFNARNDVIYWKPLRDIKGWRVVGDSFFREDCWTRYLCKCFSFCNPLQAAVTLEIATAKGFPVAVRRVGTYPKYGKIAEEPVHEFRELMGQVIIHSNKANNALAGTTH